MMSKRKFEEAIGDHAKIAAQSKIRRENTLSEDHTFKYDFMISLQKMAMAKVITTFCMKYIQEKMISQPYKQIFENIRNIEKNIFTKVSQMHLPSSVATSLTEIVPFFTRSILNWIKYHLKYVFNLCGDFSDCYINITWDSRGRIDYGQTAKNILANKDNNLSDVLKYRLACTCCLQEEIAILAPKVVGPGYLNSVDIRRYPMVYFWTAHVTGSSDCNRRHIDMSFNEYIFRSLLSLNDGNAKITFNEVPIRYMWNRLSEKEKSEYIATLITELDSQDFRYSLLSSLNHEQQQKAFRELSGCILRNMLNDWLWEKYFLKNALHVLKIMKPRDYLLILGEVIAKMREFQKREKHNYYRYQFSVFQLLWQESSRHQKDAFFKEFNSRGCLPFFLGQGIFWRQDIGIFEFILRDLNVELKKKLILSPSGVNYCTHLIQNDNLELVIKSIDSFSAEEINRLKEGLTEYPKNLELFEYFLKMQAFDKAEHFVKWAVKPEEEVQFKKNLAKDMLLFGTIYESIVSGELDFVMLDNHFKWCANGDLAVVGQLKTFSIKYCGTVFIKKLIYVDNYKLLDKILNWSFSDDQLLIAQYKSNMYKNYIYSDTLVSLASGLILKGNSMGYLDKFINWCFTDEQEKQRFKKWLLYSDRNSCYSSVREPGVCADSLLKGKFELADDFFKWCEASAEDIKAFKTKLFSEHLSYITWTCGQDVWPLLIKWCNPSKETVAKFKRVSAADCPSAFNKHLDEFIKTQSSLN